MKANYRRMLWLALAYLCIVLGAAGIFLPLLPTVPFLLLATYAAMHSSPQLAHRLLNHKWFGPPLRDYREHKSVKRSIKIKSISFLWLSLLVSIAVIDTTWVRIMLLCIGAAVTIHVVGLRTLPSHKN